VFADGPRNKRASMNKKILDWNFEKIYM